MAKTKEGYTKQANIDMMRFMILDKLNKDEITLLTTQLVKDGYINQDLVHHITK